MHTCETVPEIKIAPIVPESTPVPSPNPPLLPLSSLSPQSLDRHWSAFCHHRRFPRLLHEQSHATCPLAALTQPDLMTAIPVTASGGHSLLLLSSIPVFEFFTVSLSIPLFMDI